MPESEQTPVVDGVTESGIAVRVVEVGAIDAEVYIDGHRARLLYRPRWFRDGGTIQVGTDRGMLVRRRPEAGGGWFLDGEPIR